MHSTRFTFNFLSEISSTNSDRLRRGGGNDNNDPAVALWFIRHLQRLLAYLLRLLCRFYHDSLINLRVWCDYFPGIWLRWNCRVESVAVVDPGFLAVIWLFAIIDDFPPSASSVWNSLSKQFLFEMASGCEEFSRFRSVWAGGIPGGFSSACFLSPSQSIYVWLSI